MFFHLCHLFTFRLILFNQSVFVKDNLTEVKYKC